MLLNREILLYCDLASQVLPPAGLPTSLTVERKKSAAELTPQSLADIISIWNPKLAQGNMKERFGKGASLWLIKSAEKLVGYVWTMQGGTISPHYLPLAPNDVHFFDLYVSPEYRGRGMNWFLISHILHRLAAEGGSRAFSEVAEWNQASLSSFAMTPFRPLGCGRKMTLFGRTVVYWDEKVQRHREDGVSRTSKAAPQKRLGV